jgi:hypothetical protein
VEIKMNDKIEVKVKTIEIENEVLELNVSIPISSVTFVQTALNEFYSSAEKLKQWFNVEKIDTFLVKRLQIDSIVSLKNIAKKNKRKIIDRKEIAIKMFDEFHGTSVMKKDLTKWINEKFISNSSYASTICGEILEKINGIYCTWNKETNLINFIPKTKVSGENMQKLTYDNAQVQGFD